MVGSRQTKPPTIHYPNTTKVLHIQISLLIIINNSFYKDIATLIFKTHQNYILTTLYTHARMLLDPLIHIK
jgi:hypothetical protein